MAPAPAPAPPPAPAPAEAAELQAKAKKGAELVRRLRRMDVVPDEKLKNKGLKKNETKKVLVPTVSSDGATDIVRSIQEKKMQELVKQERKKMAKKERKKNATAAMAKAKAMAAASGVAL